MDPFAPGRSYSRRSSSGQDQNSRNLSGHPHSSSPSSTGLPPPSPFGTGRASSFGSSTGGMHRLPSPGDALRGPDRFEHSLDLPPLHNVPRSTSPILGRSNHRSRGHSDLPPPSGFDSTGFGPNSFGSSGGRFPGSGPADGSTDPFGLPSLPPMRRGRSRSGSLSMDTDQPDQFSSMYPNRPSSGGLGPSSGSSFGQLSSLPPLSSFPGTGQLGSGGLPSASTTPFSPSSTEDGELGPSHASRNIRKFSKRATFSHSQLGIMEDLWSQTEYPSNDQIEACAESTGLLAKQIRTWFGNTRQARLAGTRKEARHAPIPSQSGSGTTTRRGRGDTNSMYQSLGSGPGMSPMGSSTGFPILSSSNSFGHSTGGLPSLSHGGFDPSNGLSGSRGGPLPGINSFGYEPTSAGFRSSGGQGPLFPHLDPLPEAMGGTGGLLPGFGGPSSSGLGGPPASGGFRSRRRSTTSYPSMNFDHGLPPPSKRY